MRKNTAVSLGLIFLVFHISALQADQKVNETITKRLALIVGANNGGRDRVQLKYAVSDARSIKKVFEEIGSVISDDSKLLADPDRETLLTEIETLQKKIDQAKSVYSRVEVFFYYSGHSDEEHILLGGEKLSYKELREAINSMGSDVRIAILDSCASGAFTRLKGGKKKSPFLTDSAYNMKGYAVMTSSSSDEASQESDQIKASFFTHYLVSGMRGAADMTQDGRVTLSEAYQFAFLETLAQTTKTTSGPQHPNYNIQMTGTGDVVMTDIRKSTALLNIHKDLSGRIFIYNKNESLLVELTKPQGRLVELGLEEGGYRVINLREGNAYETKLTLKRGKSHTVDSNNLSKTDRIYTTSRGGVPFPTQRGVLSRVSVRVRGGYGGLPGDINTWIATSASSKDNYFLPLENYTIGELEKLKHWGFEMQGECLMNLNENMALGIGSGYFGGNKDEEIVLDSEPGETVHYASQFKITAVPIKVSAYYLLPVASFGNIFVNGGVGYYFGKLNYTFEKSIESDGFESLQKAEGQVKDNGFGLHSGIGFETKLTAHLALYAVGEGRYCKLKDWQGNKTITTTTHRGGDPQETRGEDFGRKFEVDLSGFSLNVGIRIKF